jgi:hypothetical protein
MPDHLEYDPESYMLAHRDEEGGRFVKAQHFLGDNQSVTQWYDIDDVESFYSFKMNNRHYPMTCIRDSFGKRTERPADFNEQIKNKMEKQ